MNKVAMVAEMEIMHSLSNINFHSPKMTWICPLLHAHSASIRDQHWVPDMTSFPGEISQLPNDKLIILHHTNNGRGSNLFLLKYTITLNIHFPYMSTSLLSKTLPMDLQNALSIIILFNISLLLIMKLSSQKIK